MDNAAQLTAEIVHRLAQADEPARGAALASDTEVKLQPREGGRERILLVEDEPPVRTVIAEMLRRSGYEVLDAAGAVEALELLADDTTIIDLVLTDLVMPELGGIDLARRARELRPTVQVLFMSGYAPPLTTVDDPATHDSLLLKPFGHAELTAAVGSALERAEPRAHL